MRKLGKAIVNFIKGSDNLGHGVKVHYKGKEHFTTVWGGIVSLMMQGMLFYLVGTSAYEMVFMDDPEIGTFTKPLAREEKIELVPLIFSDYDYVIAIKTDVWDYNAYSYSRAPLPIELGIITPWVVTPREGGGENWKRLKLYDCSEILSKETIDASS